MSSSTKKSLNQREANNLSNYGDVAVDAYLLNALNMSPKDRPFILKTESTLINAFLRSSSTEMLVDFPELNSYYRMLVHRVARYYDLEHTADSEMRSVTVWRPRAGKERPVIKLSDMVEPSTDCPPSVPVSGDAKSSTPKFTIMKRSSPASNYSNPASSQPKGSLSLEEREKQYELARARIFKDLEESRLLEDDDGKIVESFARLKVTFEVPSVATDNSVPPLSPDEIPASIMDQVSFSGWKNVDQIKPFIPVNSARKDEPTSEDSFDFGAVWIPQHVWVVSPIPTTESLLKTLKQKIKKNHGKLYVNEQGDRASGIVLFAYRTAETEQDMSNLLGVACERWKPTFLPEPPL